MAFLITKASGKQEPFNFDKLSKSLKKAGANEQLITEIINNILVLQPKTSEEIYRYAIKQLANVNKPVAARYNLKHALMEFGPAGYPFEQYVARLLQAEGYRTQTDQIVAGSCVNHEIDVIAVKNDKAYMVECKFHNTAELKTDVKVTLYIHSRFEDLNKAARENKPNDLLLYPWIFSNTNFTSDAIRYAQCVNLRLTGWGYPQGESLSDLIDKYELHPITALTSLTRAQKKMMIADGIILCHDIKKFKTQLRKYNLNDLEIEQLIKEAEGVSRIDHT